MEGLLFLFGLFLALGLFFLTASVLKLPTMGAAKAMLGTVKQERKAAKTLETYFMILAVRLSGFIRMDAYKRSRMQNVLKASGMNMTPEVYQAYALVKSGAVLLGAIPCMFLFPLQHTDHITACFQFLFHSRHHSRKIPLYLFPLCL